MKKTVLAMVVAGLCSLNLSAGELEDNIKKFERDDIFKFCSGKSSQKNKDMCYETLDFFAKKYSKECDDNIAQSCFGMGEIIIMANEDIDSNFDINIKFDEEYFKYFEKSCELNYWQGCLFLGLRYSNLAHDTKDKKIRSEFNKKSKYFFGKACKLKGDSLSCSRK